MEKTEYIEVAKAAAREEANKFREAGIPGSLARLLEKSLELAQRQGHLDGQTEMAKRAFGAA